MGHKSITVILALFFLVAIAVRAASAATRVWGLYGWGDNIAGSSSGVDDIAAKARGIPGVVAVEVRNYWEQERVRDEILAAPPHDRIVIYGYSCGLNGATTIAKLVAPRRVTVSGIQQSLWCGGDPLYDNTDYGQSTYGSCIETWGLGCKRLTAGEGFAGSIVNIRRPDLEHEAADEDLDAQQDVLDVIAQTATGDGRHHFFGHGHLLVRRGLIKIYTGVVMVRAGAQEIVRHHGEAP